MPSPKEDYKISITFGVRLPPPSNSNCYISSIVKPAFLKAASTGPLTLEKKGPEAFSNSSRSKSIFKVTASNNSGILILATLFAEKISFVLTASFYKRLTARVLVRTSA